MYQAILFDLDGTLIDTAPTLINVANIISQKYNVPLPDSNLIRENAGKGAEYILKLVFQGAVEFCEDHKDEFFDLYEKELYNETSLFPGVKKLIEQINEKKIPWGIVTSKHMRFAKPLIEHFKPLDTASCLISQDCVTHKKPDPEPLLLACKKLNVNIEDTCYIGDAKVDVNAAKAIKMDHIVVTYGYFSSNDQPESWCADKVIDNIEDIYPMIFTKI